MCSHFHKVVYSYVESTWVFDHALVAWSTLTCPAPLRGRWTREMDGLPKMELDMLQLMGTAIHSSSRGKDIARIGISCTTAEMRTKQTPQCKTRVSPLG